MTTKTLKTTGRSGSLTTYEVTGGDAALAELIADKTSRPCRLREDGVITGQCARRDLYTIEQIVAAAQPPAPATAGVSCWECGGEVRYGRCQRCGELSIDDDPSIEGGFGETYGGSY